MAGICRRNGRFWRQLTSCVVAYAFVLHTSLFGLASAQFTAISAGQGSLNAALCLHDDADTPLAPDGNSDGNRHCTLCAAGGHPYPAAPPAPPRFVMAAADRAQRLASDWFIPDPIKHASARPRGPPLTA